MTFESLAIAGLSLGLTMSDILDMRIGLTIGLLNEKMNQMYDYNKRQKQEKQDVIQGDASMLMKM